MLQPEICHSPVNWSPEELAPHTASIPAQEAAIGIFNERGRWAEATLFVDDAFLAIEALNGRKTGFERLLGDLEWEGYVYAKDYCDNYGRKPVTPEFFLNIHHEFLACQAPHVAGTYATGFYRGVRLLKGEIMPLKYSTSEVAEINANPLLDFEVAGDDPHVGFLHYQFRSPKGHQAAIAEVCEWYNDTAPSSDPIELAALLQRKLIERHAYAYGICGRVSRMAMNWSLLSNDCPPSSLRSFNNDILVPEQQWVEEVRAGCRRYEYMQELAGFPSFALDPADFFGIKPHEAFDERRIKPPIKLEPGQYHDRVSCENFLTETIDQTYLDLLPTYEFTADGSIVLTGFNTP